MLIQVDIEVIRPDYYTGLPGPATPGSAGCALRACITEDQTIWPNQALRVPAGIRVALPPGWVMLLLPRSGLGGKNGLVLGNLVGLIDPDFRGEIELVLWNRSDEMVLLRPGMRVAQAIFVPYATPIWRVQESLSGTDRGDGGFNSTGVD